MATYPSINFNSTTGNQDNVIYLPSNVFICGFTARGPEQKQTTVTSLTDFANIYGIPNTAAEYSMYEAVRNTIRGGGLAHCYRIPYVEQQDISANAQAVTYYCSVNDTSALSDIVESYDISSNYTSTAVAYKLGQHYSTSTAYNWHLNRDISVDTHELTISCKTKARTIFDIDISGNVSVDVNAKQRSLGIVPVFIGSLNTLLVSTGYAGIQDALKATLQTAIYSTVIQSNILCYDVSSSTALLAEYNHLTSSNDIYVMCLDIVANNLAETLTTTTKSQSAMLVVEIILDDNNEITAKLLEYFIGTLDNNVTYGISNLIDLINNQSNFISVEFKSLSDSNDTATPFIDEDVWHYVEPPTEMNPLYAFGINSKTYDVQVDEETTAYEFNSDNLFGLGGISDHIIDMSKKTYIDNRILDYIALPSIVDCFNTTLSSTQPSAETYNGIQYKSNQYYIPHDFSKTTLDKFDIDTLNVKALLNCAAKFAELDKDSTVFFDLPIITTYELSSIVDTHKSDATQTAHIIATMSSLDLIPASNVFVSPKYSNIMFVFNHQYVDKFGETAEYMIVPPSTEMLYAYCYADYYRAACPLAGLSVADWFNQCHSGVINSKNRNIFKTLFTTYLINSLMTDINNQVMPNQQMLYRQQSKSIFAQHHAFRLAKYLKRHLRQLGTSILYEPHTPQLRVGFTNNINSLLAKYKSNNVIENYLVICDETNNPANAIDNNELWAKVYVTILGAVVSINLNITQIGVNIVLD